MKNIAILDVGGTISCFSSKPTDEFYKIKGNSINSLIEELSLPQNVKINYEFFSNKISHELSAEDLLDLAKKIQELVDNDETFGAVISIGTNALEDIAYFIDLVVRTSKTIVFTGSYFPQNHLVYDGKKNLYNALVIALHDNAQNLGTLITFNDTVVSAKWATKTKPGLAENFSNDGVGVIGYIIGDVFHQMMRPILKTYDTNFSIKRMSRYPKIGVLYSHLGMDLDYINYLIHESKIEGLISAGFGKGYQTKEISMLLKQAVEKKNFTLVRCSRSGFFLSNKDVSYDDRYGFICASQLSPQKAAILLSVCLAHNLAKQEIQKAFFDVV
jgi:L-asparaginase